jgi:uncharacterized protein
MRRLLAAALLFASVAGAHAETDHAIIARAALNGVIRPGYAELSGQTASLKDKVERLCKQPSASSLEASKDAFVAAVAAWSRVEILRFGPIATDHRYERIFYWPDPKGLGRRQIERALAKQDQTLTEPDALPAKSVALQGLTALEYLLYGDGADALLASTGDGAFRCAYASSVATNIDRIARTVAEDWREGSSYSKAFLTPDSGSVYRTSKEVTLELFKSLTSGIELVRDQKLGKPLGASPAQARPELAAFWRSGLSLASAAGNLEGLRILFANGGFAQIVADESPGVENSILFDLDHAIDVLSRIDEPIAEVAKDEALRGKIEALRVSLKSAEQTAAAMISRGAGLSFGFNALDGD